jgi:hypothetical protein
MQNVTYKEKVCHFPTYSPLFLMHLAHHSTKLVITLGKKIGLSAQPRMHHIFLFTLFRKMNLPICVFRGPDMWKSSGAKCILYGGGSSSTSFKSRLVLNVLLAVCGRALSCCRITVRDNGPLASCRYRLQFVG